MLLKFSALIGLVATLVSVHRSEAASMGTPGLSFQDVLIISPVYRTKNPSDTFAQACASNTVQFEVETKYSNTKSVGVCDVDLTKLGVEQYCPLTGSDFFGLSPCGNAVIVVKGDPEVVANRDFSVTIEADFSASVFPPKVTRCSPLKVAGENSAGAGAGTNGASRRVRKRQDFQAKKMIPGFQCPSE